MTIYVSSDWHIQHDKDFIWKERGFETLTDHDVEILKHVDALLETDMLIFVGDMAMSVNRKALIADVFDRCRARIIFCRGNHDPTLKQLTELSKGTTRERIIVNSYRLLSLPDTFILGHYPPTDAEGASHNSHAFDAPEYVKGVTIVHGHTHSKIRRSKLGAVNVCWDAWGRFPTIEDVRSYTREHNYE